MKPMLTQLTQEELLADAADVEEDAPKFVAPPTDRGYKLVLRYWNEYARLSPANFTWKKKR
jgi:hypothetical protein